MKRLLLPISIVGLVLRTRSIDDSLWLDELHTSWVVSGNPGEIFSRAKLGNQSPLWFVMPWMATNVVDSELSLRLPALVCGVALISVTYWAVRQWIESKCFALFASAIVAIHYDAIYYSQEARPYSCVQLVVMLHAGLLAIRFRSSDGDVHKERGKLLDRSLFDPRQTGDSRIWTILTRTLLVYLHYTTVLFLFAEVVFRFLVASRSVKGVTQAVKSLAVDYLMTAILCTPLAWHVFEVFSRRQNWSLFVERQPLTSLPSMFSMYDYLPLMLGCSIALFFCIAGGQSNRVANTGCESKLFPSTLERYRISAACLWGICWLAVPVVTAWLLTDRQVAPVFFRRYLLPSGLAAIFLSAVFLSACTSQMAQSFAANVRRSRFTQSVLWVSTIATLGAIVGNARYLERFWHDSRVSETRHQNWRGAIAEVKEIVGNDALPVFLVSSLIEADGLKEPNNPTGSDPLLEYLKFPLMAMYRTGVEGKSIIPLPRQSWEHLSRDNTWLVQQSNRLVFVVNSARSDPLAIDARLRRADPQLWAAFEVGRNGSFEDIRVIEYKAKEEIN